MTPPRPRSACCHQARRAARPAFVARGTQRPTTNRNERAARLAPSAVYGARRCVSLGAVRAPRRPGSAARGAAEVHVFEGEIKGAPVTVGVYGFAAPRFAAQEHDDRPQVQFTPNPAFTLQRARLGVDGKLSDRAELRFEMEIGKDFVQGIDAYVEGSPLVDPRATVTIRFGQFRVPFSRQNLLSSGSLQLPDAAYFVTPKYVVDRDIGAMVIGASGRIG